jgi:hypothetical protein
VLAEEGVLIRYLVCVYSRIVYLHFHIGVCVCERVHLNVCVWFKVWVCVLAEEGGCYFGTWCVYSRISYLHFPSVFLNHLWVVKRFFCIHLFVMVESVSLERERERVFVCVCVCVWLNLALV